MIVNLITNKDKETFCKLCECFYNSGATKRGFDLDSAILTFDQVTSSHENLWGYFIQSSDDNSIVGYALVTSYWCNEEAGNVLVLDELYIDPNYRHHGYGKRFIEWLTQEFHNKAVTLTLEVLSTNIKALGLYGKEGFVDDGFEVLSKKI